MACTVLRQCSRLPPSQSWVRSLHTGSRRQLPQVTVDTNLPSEKIPDTFVKDLSSVVAQTLGKKEKVGSTWEFK